MYVFPESKNAHKWLDGKLGIEIGSAAHNSFGIVGCKNVDVSSPPPECYILEQVGRCGTVAEVDIVDDGEYLRTIPDASQEFILSSHVVEHFPNLFRAIQRWCEVLVDGGLIYMIIPLPDALPTDAERPLTSYDHLRGDFLTGQDVLTHHCEPGQGVRGHYHVFSPKSFRKIMERYSKEFVDYPNELTIVDSLDVDDKVGNGFTMVLQFNRRKIKI